MLIRMYTHARTHTHIYPYTRTHVRAHTNSHKIIFRLEEHMKLYDYDALLQVHTVQVSRNLSFQVDQMGHSTGQSTVQ